MFVSSQTPGNPYRVGAKERFFDAGLYCETVVNTNGRLLVPDALADPDWEDNPDIELDMISYLGFPILHEDGRPFGTICVLDSKANSYSATYERLMLQFKEVIESHLALLELNHRLDQQNWQLTQYLDEIQTLRGIIPICSFCKKIRDDGGFWHAVEKYIARHPEADFSHGVCPPCAEERYGVLASAP